MTRRRWYDHKVRIELFDDEGTSEGKETVCCVEGRLAFDRGRPETEDDTEWVPWADGAVDPVPCPKCHPESATKEEKKGGGVKA